MQLHKKQSKIKIKDNETHVLVTIVIPYQLRK
jgi:hypothetical protein